MVVWIQHRQGQSILRAQREPLDRTPESQRYWTGDHWSHNSADAEVFDDSLIAKQYRDTHNLCGQMPLEWQRQEPQQAESRDEQSHDHQQ